MLIKLIIGWHQVHQVDKKSQCHAHPVDSRSLNWLLVNIRLQVDIHLFTIRIIKLIICQNQTQSWLLVNIRLILNQAYRVFHLRSDLFRFLFLYAFTSVRSNSTFNFYLTWPLTWAVYWYHQPHNPPKLKQISSMYLCMNGVLILEPSHYSHTAYWKCNFLVASTLRLSVVSLVCWPACHFFVVRLDNPNVSLNILIFII